MRPPPLVDWTWEAGWLFCGDYPQAVDGGFPVLSRPTLRAQGPVDLMVRGGTASFLDGNGTLREVRLGDAEDPGSPSAPGAGVRRQTYLYFHGEVHDADVAPSGTWGLAGPDVSWRVVGSLATERATGEYRDEGRLHSFTDAPLRATGDLALRPEARAGAMPTAPDAYQASGRFDALHVAGARVAQPEAPSLAAPAAGATALGVLLLALTKTGRELLARAFAPLYTRLGPGDVLDHEARRRLHGMVSAEPGIHLKELGRRAGLSWGALRFHVQMLRKAGLLTLHRRGGHVHVYPAGVGPAAVSPVLHPLAERILASLPDDGTPLEARALQAKVGASRQLLGYHLRRLAADERVRLTGSRPVLVARVRMAAPADPPR